MENMIRVAHLQLLPLLTGVQRVSLDELERLDLDQFKSYLICKEPGALTMEAKSKGIETLYCPNLTREISPWNDILAFFQLYRFFRRYKFDVVHSHSSKTGVIGRVAAKLAGVPMVIHTVHGFAFPAATNQLEKLVYLLMEWVGTKCSDKIICLHDADRDIAVDSLGAKDEQLEVIANGVDNIKYSPVTDDKKKLTRYQLGLKEDSTVVGMVGRLWNQKNPQAYIEAAINTLSKNVDADFVLVGDGELKVILENKVEEAGFSNRVHFLGWRSDIPQILAALDIFVLPSLWEGMPLAILEAQATGLPCVVSNIQGNNHLVTNNKDGLLFDLREPEQLSEKIISLIDNKTKRIQLGQNARKKVLDKYNIDLRIKKIARLYLSHNVNEN
ncbi:glycosyltransferase family 4 protein [Photobacterium swingsii]|uniref:glycosyltransferase family 4 protein n=1 Tax=Photobacterium swingsii TaxID=680026 RepID=UPI00406847FE